MILEFGEIILRLLSVLSFFFFLFQKLNNFIDEIRNFFLNISK